MSQNRQQLILRTLIKEYVKTGQPVSSGGLAANYRLGVSPATIRNDLMALEESGYIYQPHTSAGRVPTEAAYLLEIEALGDHLPELKTIEASRVAESLDTLNRDLRNTAKVLADLAGNAIFWAFHKNDLYYTGLSNIFMQPEFKQSEAVYDVSLVIDRMEEIIDKLFDELADGLYFKVGTNNPFGPFLGTTMIKYRQKNHSGLCGILGPMRMNYGHNAALLSLIQEKLK